jgi:hypothetical protein
MALQTHAQDQLGMFIEKETGNHFEYSPNTTDYWVTIEDYPHKVWVRDGGWRYARVLKTVAYVVTDEADDGSPIVQKWELKKNTNYNQRSL